MDAGREGRRKERGLVWSGPWMMEEASVMDPVTQGKYGEGEMHLGTNARREQAEKFPRHLVFVLDL